MSTLERNKMPEQDPKVRITNFEEVALGYSIEDAMSEASRCLECKTRPCMDGCPVNVPIPEFIHELKSGNVDAAYEVISRENFLPAICGRVCPQENQCEGKCVRGVKGEAVAIGRLERFVADNGKLDKNVEIEKVNKKAAVVGSGPAGLTCAAVLAEQGIEVTLFEALHQVGGVLSYGIPEFRLPNNLVSKEVENIRNLGVKIEKNVIVGKSITVEDLRSEYDAIFIGTGAGLPKFLNIPGENLNGVYSANEFLTRVNLMSAYKFPESPTPVKVGNSVAVIGGGNVAMDAARTSKRVGAENVYVIYRRTKEELPARREEVHHAEEEGIDFRLLLSPVEIFGENNEVAKIKCQKMALGEPDASGRRRPEPIEGEFEEIEVQTVITALGQTPNPLIKDTTKDLEVNNRGCIVVNQDTMETSIENIYAGGDVVSGAATVIKAMGAGKLAAKEILNKILEKETEGIA